MTDAIGGYFGLELPSCRGEFHRHALRLQSGRAALQAGLRALSVRRVWIPWFVCRAVLDAAAAVGARVMRYTLTSLDGIPDVQPREGEAVLVVNYFGICEPATREFLGRLPAGRAIVDASQAFYARSAPPGVTTFYSPRKFFGVPDGGYLVPEPFPLPTMLDDTTTASRMAHLFRRLSGDVRGGYSDFLAAEASFDEPGIRGMSPFTFNLLKRIDYGDVASRRRTNFAFLHAHFRERNGFAALVEGAGDAVPLCYPLLLDKPADAVRSRLSEADIFIPLYWPELRAILPVDAIAERTWVANVLPLPCDQRYTPKMLERMVATVDAALG